MKRLLIFLLTATMASGADYSVKIGDITWTEHEAGVYYSLWAGGAVAFTDPLVEWLFAADATDTSGNGNNGTINTDTAITVPTNGLGGFAVMGTGTVTVAITGDKKSFSFYAKTNALWRFYEYKDGLLNVDLAAESYPTNEFFSVSGDTVTLGGADHDINTFTANSVSNDVAASTSNRITYAADTGILSQHLEQNRGLYSNCVLNVTANNMLQDGSSNNLAITSPAAPAPLGSVSNGWYQYNNNTTYIITPATSPNITTQITVHSWVYQNAADDCAYVSRRASASAEEACWTMHSRVAGTMAWRLWQSDGTLITTTGTDVTGAWALFSGVADGSNCILYENGLPTVTNSYDGTIRNNPTTNSIAIGSRYSGSASYPMDGNIDETLVHDFAQTAGEIYTYYTNSKAYLGH